MARTQVMITLLVVAFAAWYLYTPLPSNISHPWKTQGIYAFYGILGLASSTAERIGIASKIDATNYLFDGSLRILSWFCDYPGSTVVIERDVFDGVPVYIYKPTGQPTKDKLLPGFVYYHGGGWTYGDTPMFSHPGVKRMVKQLNLVGVIVDYRLAPHVKFPVQFNDCLKATKHFMKFAERYGVDGDRIVIGGDSAGGNIASAISLYLRDDVSFAFLPKAQLLIYPAVQAIDIDTPSYQQTFDPALMSRVGMSWFWSMYITGTGNLTNHIASGNHVPLAIKKKMAATIMKHKDLGDDYLYPPYHAPILTDGDERIWNEIKDVVMNQYFAPLMAEDLSNLPPTLVYTVEHDVLRDEGIWFAQRLKAAGNKVHHLHGSATFHTNMIFMDILPDARMHFDGMISFANEHLLN